MSDLKSQKCNLKSQSVILHEVSFVAVLVKSALQRSTSKKVLAVPNNPVHFSRGFSCLKILTFICSPYVDLYLCLCSEKRLED